MTTRKGGVGAVCLVPLRRARVPSQGFPLMWAPIQLFAKSCLPLLLSSLSPVDPCLSPSLELMFRQMPQSKPLVYVIGTAQPVLGRFANLTFGGAARPGAGGFGGQGI